MPGPKEERKPAIEPLKELSEAEGFNNLPELKETASPLKELTKEAGFQELSEFKEFLKPMKELEFAGPLTGKGPKDDKKEGKN